MAQVHCQEHSQLDWRVTSIEDRLTKMERKMGYIFGTCITILSTLVVELVLVVIT